MKTFFVLVLCGMICLSPRVAVSQKNPEVKPTIDELCECVYIYNILNNLKNDKNDPTGSDRGINQLMIDVITKELERTSGLDYMNAKIQSIKINYAHFLRSYKTNDLIYYIASKKPMCEYFAMNLPLPWLAQ